MTFFHFPLDLIIVGSIYARHDVCYVWKSSFEFLLNKIDVKNGQKVHFFELFYFSFKILLKIKKRPQPGLVEAVMRVKK